MPRAPHEDINIMEAGIGPRTGDYQYPPQSAENQASQGVSNFVDGSGPIFSMYLEMASEEDKKMAEGWKADADGIPYILSIQDIRPNPQDTSNFYLANIYQTISNPNQSNISLPSSPPPFSPPTYAVWVNSLWFLSLVISISCALLATLLQQWARRYLKITQPRYSPHKRARIRAFFAEGVDKFLLPWAVEALPTLLHISLFLFFAGLIVFLWNVNLTVFKLALSWVSICTTLYGCITFMPIFCHNSPYYTPLSLPASHIVIGISCLVFRALRKLTYSSCFSFDAYDRFRTLDERSRELLVQGMQKAAEETALILDEDHELERFFSGLPDFRSSKVVEDPLPSLSGEQQWKLLNALVGFRRAVVCARAIDLEDIPYAFQRIFSRIVSECHYVQSARIARLIRGWGNSGGGVNPVYISAIVSSIVAKAQRHDDHWFAIASDDLGVPESILRDYAAHGDSLSLAILIHLTRQQFSHYREESWPASGFLDVLRAASAFEVQETSFELQHEFCALWNQIVCKAQNNNDRHAASILGAIRNVYIALHQGTDSAPTRFSRSTSNYDQILYDPTLYPRCDIPGHHLDSQPQIHDDSASTTFSHVVAPVLASLANPDALPSSVPALHHVDETHTDVPLLDNIQPVHQTAIKTPCIPVTSPDPATASASSVMPSDPPNLPSSVFSQPVLDNILPTYPPQALHSSIPRPRLSLSFPESHCPITVTTFASTSPGPISAHGLSTSAKNDGNPKPGSRKERDVDPPSANCKIHPNTMSL
ncbi:hypothetical protein EDB87DRAFT_1834605 [Lactarius vividus]|nr:hypothetical protein EDB87DRAFT_1834605 [Lactarius vividus]